jgi:glycosyltransferase involved in cell wall biosynthesis
MKRAVVFWGKRGGGSAFAEQVYLGGLESSWPVILVQRPTSSGKFRKGKKLSSFQILSWFKERNLLVKSLIASEVNLVTIAMASPWDLFMGKKLMKNGIRVSRVIHDASPHLGEFFPPRFWISLLVKDCERIVVLSRFVAEELVTKYRVEPSMIVVSNLPIGNIDVSKLQANKSGQFLLVGRGKKYKGQSLLQKAWQELNTPRHHLLIAGEGFKVEKNGHRILFLDKWLSDEELFQVIFASDVVVFPYLEASQSGLIPICRALKVPVVVTPVGGLPEQVIHGVTGLVADGLGSDDLARSLDNSINIKWNIPDFDARSGRVRVAADCLFS